MSGFAAMPAMAAPDLTAGTASGIPGQSVQIPVTIDTDDSVVALQLDLDYNPTLLSATGITAGSALADHTFDWTEVAPGKLRLVFTTATQSALQDGELATLTLLINEQATPGMVPLKLSAIVQADANAALVTVDHQNNGSVEVLEVPEVVPVPLFTPLGVVLMVAILLLGLWVFHQRGLIGISFSVVLSLVLFSSTNLRAAIPPGDANNDGVVDTSDIAVIVAQILERSTAPGDPDCNQDLLVDVRDTICVTQGSPNNPPDLIAPGDRQIQADILFETPIFATDPDTADVLTFGLDTAPAGMSINPVSGLLSWTPSDADLGSNTVTASVTDSGGLSDTETFDVSVVLPVAVVISNAPPKLTVPDNQSLTIGNPMRVTATASDADNDPLTFALVNAPTGMSIDSVSGVITWTPAEALIGSHDVAVKVGDPNGGVDFGSFIVMVSDVNKAPVASDDVYEARLGVPLKIDAPGILGNDTDENGDALTAALASYTGPGELSLNDDGSFDYLLEPPDLTTPVELEIYCDNTRNPGSLGTDSAVDSRYQTNNTLAVGDVDNDGRLEIIGKIHLEGSTALPEVWIMNAEDCTEQFHTGPDLEQAGAFDYGSHVGLHDIDGDGDLEIIGTRSRYPTNLNLFDGEHLIAIHHDGTLAWGGDGASETSTIFTENNSQQGFSNTGPTFVDLEGDGTTEIVMASSIGFSHDTFSVVIVFNAADGSIKWEYLADVEQSAHNPARMPYVVDLDLDGTMEVIVHNSVIDHTGALEFTLPSRPNQGTSASGHLSLGIGNFDDDAFPELVGRDYFKYYMFEHDGTLTWEFESRNTSNGQITVADFDGDGELEFASIGCLRYVFTCGEFAIQVFNADGSPLWDHSDQPDFHLDYLSERSGNITAFDANRDGAMDLVFRNDRGNVNTLFIYDGRDGSVLTSIPARHYGGSLTEQRFVTIADINGDGHAEIINSHTGGIEGQTEIWTGTTDNPLPKAPPYRNQWNFHEAYVNDDLTIPTAPVPHWLRPGLNGYHMIMPEPHPLVGADDTFIYKANDGALDSNIATVTLDILPAGNPPQFLGEPDALTTRGFPYNYAPIVYDPDLGDTVTFQLLAGPDGMTIDPATGEISWLPNTIGTYPISIMATDTIGFAGNQAWNLEVGEPVAVPDVVGLPEATAVTDIANANLVTGAKVSMSHPTIPIGSVYDQQPPGGTVAEFGATVKLYLSTGPGPLDTDNDVDGFTENEGDCDDGDDSIYPGATDTNGDGIDQDCDGIDGNLVLDSIVVMPDVSDVLTGQDVKLKAYGIFEDGTSQNLTGIVSWSNGPSFSSPTAGVFPVSASRGAIVGNATINVYDRVPGDDTPPIAEITAPADDFTITEAVEIIGTASDDNFLKYDLSYAVAGSDEFTTFASGTSPVVNGILGQFDPTLLLNGFYTLRLTVSDAGGNQTVTETVVLSDGLLKVGQFSVSFSDSSLPTSGIPLELIRTYDSRNRSKGDFGIGWTLSFKGATLNCLDPLGEDWTVVKAGLSWNLLPNRGHACVLQIPGERAELFDFVPNPAASPIVPFSLLSGSFVPRSGTRGVLEDPDGINLAIVTPQPGPAQLLNDDDFTPYAPERLRYTRADGLVLEFVDGDLVSITDPSGNAIAFSDGGLMHSNGRGFTFSRDASDRITSISDPMGNTQQYQYSPEGNLVSHTDAIGNITRYFYNLHHGLLRIEDPLNRPMLRNDYDDQNRLISTTEPDGRVVTFDHSADGKTQTITDADGSVTIITSDDSGNVTDILDALGGQVLQSFDAQGNLLSRTDENGNTTTWTWDAKGNKLTETDALGNTLSWTYDTLGNPTSRTDELGRTSTFNYNASGLAISRINAGGVVDSTLTWDAHGNLLARTNALGNSETFTYNAFGDPTSVNDARGNQATFNYDANGALLSKTDKLGDTTTFTRNDNGDVLSETDPLGRTTQYEYDAAGQLIRVTDPTGAVKENQYDGEGKVIAITDPLGQTTQFEYSLQGNLTRQVGPGGQESIYEYDPLDRQTRVKTPGGQDVTIAYDNAGNLASQEDALGHAFQVSWDVGDRPDVMTAPDGSTVQRVYDAVGNLLQQTDAMGRTTHYEYDALNRLVRTVLPDGSDELLAYDNAGNLIQKTDQAGNGTSYEYDANNNLVKVTEPLGGETLFEYDANDRLVVIEDARGNRTLMEHDTAGQLTRRIYPDGTVEETRYDAAGRVISTTDPDGDVTQYLYDAKGRLVSKTYADAAVETFAWDANDQLTGASNAEGTVELQYDAEGLLATVLNPDGSSLNYDYNATGRVTSITTRTAPAASDRTTLMEYDEFGRLIRVEDPDGAVTSYSFDAMSNLLSTTYPNGAQSDYQYDLLNRLVQVTHSNGGGDLAQYSYTLDALGNRTHETLLDGSLIEYEYDARSRLIRESHFDAAAVKQFELSYEYDAVGNRTRTVDLAGQEILYNYNQADQLLSRGDTTYAYGADGNLASHNDAFGTTLYEFDSRNRLIEVQRALDQVNFSYDARGERVSRSVNGVESNFLVGIAPPSLPSQVLVEYDDVGNSLAENVFGNRQVSRQQGGTTTYTHIDASLNVRLLTDGVGAVSDSYDYDAFGNLIAEAGTTSNPYRFAGEQLGQTEGLTYLRARYYDPKSGRFTGRDPFNGLPEMPSTLHRYMYGFQNPLRYSDPTGELSFSSVVTAVTIVGLVVGIGVNYLTDVKSSAKELKGLTDQFRAKFCRGGLLGEGAALADQTVLIAEDEEKLRPSGPTSANYSVFAFGWGWGIGTIGSNSGDEQRFPAPGTRNVTQFEGTGKMYTGGYSVGVGSYGAGGVAGEAHFLPDGSEIPITSSGRAGSALGTAGAAAVSLTTFWNLQGKNNALGWDGRLDCYRKPSK